MYNSYQLIIKPYISATNNLDNLFGFYYSNEDNPVDKDSFTLLSLENSGDPFKMACSKIAYIWLETCQKEIFREIGNFEYLLDIEYGKRLYHLEGLTKLDNIGKLTNVAKPNEVNLTFLRNPECKRSNDYETKIGFRFIESAPNSISKGFLNSIVEEVKSGGDTWDCGDFGDITYEIAQKYGFGDKWVEVFQETCLNIYKIVIRVHLSDPNSYIDEI